MSIEMTETRLLLDRIHDDELGDEILELERQNLQCVYVVGSLDTWEKIERVLCALRGANIASLLLMTRVESEPPEEEMRYVLSFLRNWDQLLLHNILALRGRLIPNQYDQLLRNEAKVELKWFREWLMAQHDPRLYKYPGLPWRSFIRKIVAENYSFTDALWALEGAQDSEITRKLALFLEAKKKVVCIFPKRWGKVQ